MKYSVTLHIYDSSSNQVSMIKHPEMTVALVASTCSPSFKYAFFFDCFSHQIFKGFKIIVCKTYLSDKKGKLSERVHFHMLWNINMIFLIN